MTTMTMTEMPTRLANAKENLKKFTERTDEAAKRGLVGDPTELKNIMVESVSYTSGVAAVLLQIAHPGVGRGVALHSNFSYRLMERNDNTAIFMYTMVWGTPEQKAAIKAAVDRAHAPVNDDKTARTYNAFDPKLQLWVAATIYASMVESYEAVYGPLDPVASDKAYQQFSVMGTALQVPLEMWPATRKDFWEYYKATIANDLEALPEVKPVLRDLFHPEHLPFWLKPAVWLYMPIIRASTTEQLPPNVRAMFGIESTKSSQKVYRRFMAYNKTVYPYTPPFLRQWPKNYYLYLLKKKLKKGGLKTGNRTGAHSH
jgi:uncharacterized protein (DUF2236 family)